MNEAENERDHAGDHSAPGMNRTRWPFCNSTDLVTGSWYLDDGEVDALECSECFAGAPVATWGRLASPWRSGEPPIGQRVLLTYRQADGRESLPIIGTRQEPAEDLRPAARWMPIPEVAR